MIIDHNIVGPLSALLGALLGGLASMIGAIYTHRRNERLQRVASEVAKREAIYADFVMSAVSLVLKAYTRDELELSIDEPRLIGLVNRMRIFASPEVVKSAEAVLTSIVAISLEPAKQLRDLAQEALTRNLDPDPLLEFSLVCRADLENVRETTV
jgi:hypothetical protein